MSNEMAEKVERVFNLLDELYGKELSDEEGAIQVIMKELDLQNNPQSTAKLLALEYLRQWVESHRIRLNAEEW